MPFHIGWSEVCRICVTATHTELGLIKKKKKRRRTKIITPQSLQSQVVAKLSLI